MREIRTSGSEGGVSSILIPTPILLRLPPAACRPPPAACRLLPANSAEGARLPPAACPLRRRRIIREYLHGGEGLLGCEAFVIVLVKLNTSFSMRKFLSILLASSFLFSASLMGAVKVGEKAPDFTLKTVTGETVSLSDYAGKFVVLEWVNPHCPFVKKFYDADAMQAFQRKAQDKGVVWLTINSTKPSHGQYVSAADTVSYMAEKKVPSTWLYDSPGAVGKLYGATHTPHMYVINPNGTLVYQGAIDDQNSANPKTLDGAHNYVFAALDAAMAGQPVKVAQTRAYGCTVKY
jgi:peroxiredoxin